MEKVVCKRHGSVCMLKTGVKDGPNKGRSFYICVDKQGCDFTQASSLPPSCCLQHEDSTVELRALTSSQQQKTYRLFYRCVEGKRAGQKWCGNVPWANAEKKSPLTESQPLSTSVAPVRNPFKAPSRTHSESSVWRKIQEATKEEQHPHNNDNDKAGSSETKENEEKAASRDRVLPPGMRLKKKEVPLKDDLQRHSGDGPEEETKKDSDEDKKKEQEKKQEKPRTTSAFVFSGKTAEKFSDAQKKGDRGPGAESRGDRGPGAESRGDRGPGAESRGDRGPGAESRGDRGPGAESRGDRGPGAEPEGDSAGSSVKDQDEDEVVLVSVQPPPLRLPSQSAVQKTLTTFSGFQKASSLKPPQNDPQGLRSLLTSQLQQKKATLGAVNLDVLPDKGARLKTQVKELEEALDSLSLSAPSAADPEVSVSSAPPAPLNPFSRPGGTVLLSAPPPAPVNPGTSSSAGTFYGGRMTDDRLLAVRNATSDAIDHLHRSLESCPGPDSEAPDPTGIKVSLLPHQKIALSWLLWREEHNPCGGILADDMGLGKTLTMISLVLSQKKKSSEEEEPAAWLSKHTDGEVRSRATLIVCPASLVHHWKKEVERHVRPGRLSVCLYHGANREKSATRLADHDVVVTTYGLVSKEIPPPKDGAEESSDASGTIVSRGASPLLRIHWSRIVLDEAHNIKNPKVQTSIAVCRLRAQARWAVTGTPIQNQLLDLYSLLKFLRCAPFDEYKLWKAQVDNGSKRGRERLQVLTRTLLLRRTKDQLDSSGRPLVSLPERSCELHQLRLSEDEQAVYDVLFAQSRSTLQNYLKRHEGQDCSRETSTSSNPFNRVAQEFGMSQSSQSSQSLQLSQSSQASQSSSQASSTIHILSLLLRLRQCCCHLSLLKKTLDSAELQEDGVVLSLEEQLSALSLTSSSSNPEESVSLNGTPFLADVFEEGRHSTKISAIMSELKAISERGPDQKSVIVSQWTSMLNIVALHLRRLKVRFAVIDGSVLPKKRMDLVEDFNTNALGPQVMLVSLCAGGVGLNLVGGNHLFLIDMHWNPALEDQACDRIYRVGQRRDVTIHKFVCEGTVEEKISTLQAKKKELAQNVLSGTGKTLSKLSLADLRLIFGV